MFQFPNVDPIPLPAPVWLFKLLHIVTLMLHFTAVQLLLGAMILAIVWNIFGKKDSAAREASNSIIKKIPTVMTYVINFGVPPLLFAQVLYGRALYTSSVLIGFYWFSVIIVLTLAYFLLYRAADRASENKPWWIYGILSFIGISYIAKVFSMNMTLMLSPEDWQPLYQVSNGFGNVLKIEPTMIPRFLFMFVGSLGLAGASLAVIGAFDKLSERTGDFLRNWGALLAIVFSLVQAALGVWVYQAQPAVVKSGLFENSLYSTGIYAWAATVLLAVLTAVLVRFGGRAKAKLLSAAAVAAAILTTAAVVLVRDGMRDLTLLAKGYDVWNRTVVSNWSVVLLFLGLFVGALVLIGVVLVAVSRSAKRVAEGSARIDDEEFTEKPQTAGEQTPAIAV
ncbi:MAG TPA: hypothetical protein VNB22_16530 [Pyrinomonadaceae bacterium]|nr:hypothetical protein [Pyrinomonadaceae bacterium]